jgi:hypothetical protein
MRRAMASTVGRCRSTSRGTPAPRPSQHEQAAPSSSLSSGPDRRSGPDPLFSASTQLPRKVGLDRS